MGSWFNYRDEVSNLVSGLIGTPGQGKWVVIRMVRVGEFSSAYDPVTHEASGGPKYDYDDFIVRAIALPPMNFATRPGTGTSYAEIYEAGREDVSFSIYAVDYKTLDEYPQWASTHGRRTPNQLDSIFDIAESVGVRRPHPPLTAVNHVAIIDSEPITGDYGKTEYILIVGRRDHSK